MSENLIQYVSAAANGDTDAMAKLYSKTLKSSYFLAEILCGDKTEAEEVTKKAYARAFCNIDKLKKPEAFEIWMKQNVAAAYRESHRFIFNDADAGAVENSADFLPESVLEDEELSAKLIAAVTSLRPELKTALVLYYNNGMPSQVLAKFLGVSESTANAIISKAKASVLSATGLEAPAEASGEALPVITRLFREKAAEVVLDGELVRNIFIFAIEAYIKANPVQEKEEEAQPEQTEETPEEQEAPETPADEEVPAEKEKVSDNVYMFKQRITDIFDKTAPSSQEEAVAEEPQAEKTEEEAEVPESAQPVQSAPAPAEEPREDLSGISMNKPKVNAPVKTVPPTNPVKHVKKGFDIKKIIDFKNIEPKKLIIAIAAIVIVLGVAIGGIAALVGGKGSGENEGDNAYKFSAGGFSDCVEIEYLDENAAMFKSATTGKYGLMDYQGNVILQPYYDGFTRCSQGREYDDVNDSYHSLVILDGKEFEIAVSNGQVVISQDVHVAHSIPTTTLEDTSYDERDRYFEGYAAARKNDKWGYVSLEKDKKVIPYEYEAVNDLEAGETAASDYCRPVTDGYIAVKKDGKMGIINLDNDTVVPFEYTNIMPGSDGVFIACKDGIWGVILIGEAQNTFKLNFNVTVTAPIPGGVTTEQSIGEFKVSSEDGTNVRSDAGSDFDKLGELDYGDKIVGFERKEADNGVDWIRFKFEKADGTAVDGWISTNMLESVQ